MNRFFSLMLTLLLLLSCAGCVGQAAAVPAPGDEAVPHPVDAETPQQPELSTDPAAPEQRPEPEEPAEPEELYVRVIDPAGPMVALTFDDGPNGVTSGKILDILEENHALATFFEVGRNVVAYPEPVKRMAEMGCEVASHSNAHRDLSKLKKSALLKDLDTADQAFLDAGVDAPTLVRPPYGAVNSTVKSSTGRAVITWTVDTLDWQSRDAQTVIDYVQGLGDLDGEIILMHSIYESTAEAVKVLVPWLQEQGYQLVTVTELMAYYYGELPQPDHFYGYTYFTTHGRTDTPAALPTPEPEETGEVQPDGAAPEADAAAESLPESVPPEEPAAPVQEPAPPASGEPAPVKAEAPKLPETAAAVPNPAVFCP